MKYLPLHVRQSQSKICISNNRDQTIIVLFQSGYVISCKAVNFYVSPLNERRHTVLFKFDFFLLLPLVLLLISEACPGHNIFVFRDRSMIFGMWVHDHKAVYRVP